MLIRRSAAILLVVVVIEVAAGCGDSSVYSTVDGGSVATAHAGAPSGTWDQEPLVLGSSYDSAVGAVASKFPVVSEFEMRYCKNPTTFVHAEPGIGLQIDEDAGLVQFTISEPGIDLAPVTVGETSAELIRRFPDLEVEAHSLAGISWSIPNGAAEVFGDDAIVQGMADESTDGSWTVVSVTVASKRWLDSRPCTFVS